MKTISWNNFVDLLNDEYITIIIEGDEPDVISNSDDSFTLKVDNENLRYEDNISGCDNDKIEVIDNIATLHARNDGGYGDLYKIKISFFVNKPYIFN